MLELEKYNSGDEPMFKYEKFTIERYKAISSPITVDVSHSGVYPIIGINECGKTTILQSILAFANYNDNLDDLYKHLQNFRNLYTEINDASISATIIGDKVDLKNLLDKFKNNTDNWDEFNRYYGSRETEKDKTIKLIITRKFTVDDNKNRNIFYNFFILDNDDSRKDFFPNIETQDKIAKEVLKMLPFIFYFDDFRDTFKGEIKLTKYTTKDTDTEKGEITFNISTDDMAGTLERIFIESYKDKPEEARKSAKDLFNMGSTELSSTESTLNKKINELINAKWTLMQKLSNEEKPKVELKIRKEEMPTKNNKSGITEETIIAEFVVKEEVNEEGKFSSIQDRSKGFLWFFTFILKTAFNPNRDINKKNSIYLLDEPGCYLHSSAQKGLCGVLETLSENSIVIYNTHSHFLLKEDFLPNIKIASKDKEKNISLDHFTQYKEKNPEALEPIRSALKVSPSMLETQFLPDNILILEGLTDFYSWNLFVTKDKINNVGIIPSTSAEHTIYLLSLMLASNKTPICLLDHDGEGLKVIEKYPEYKDYVQKLKEYNSTIESLYDEDELSNLANIYIKDEYQASIDEKKYMIPIIYKTAKNDPKYIENNLKKTNKNFNDYWRKNIKNFWNN